MRVLLWSLLCVTSVQAQGFMSFLTPFLGSGLGGGGGAPVGGAPPPPGGAGGIGSLLSGFANTGNHAGPGANMPFGDFIKMGASLFGKKGGAGGSPIPNFFQPPKPKAPKPGSAAGGGHGNMPDIEDYDVEIPQAPRPKPAHRAKPEPKSAPKTPQQRAKMRRQQKARQQRLRKQRQPKQRQAQRQKAKRQHQLAQQRRRQQQRRAQQNKGGNPQPAPAPAAALPPPSSLGWMAKQGSTAADLEDDYDDSIDLGLTGARNLRDVPPPPPQQFRPVGRSVPSQPNPAYHRPNARTFVKHRPTGPPIRPWTPRRIQPSNPVFNMRAPTAAPFTVAPLTLPPPGPTLPPPQLPKGNPKLLAHNAARMIREIASFSDSHSGQNQDFSSVQTLMEAFFTSVTDPSKGVASDFVARPLQPQFDGTEMGANRPLTNKLFESDMVLTVEQMKAVVLASNDQRRGGLRRGKRKVITGATYRWPNKPIPYRFKQGNAKWKNVIRSALQHWEKETCVRWAEGGSGKDHVVFFRGSGCYSSVGRTGGSQLISIGYGCEDKGIVTHEVGHSLGFWHEQSRPDRDQYIHLNKQFIIRGTDGNFERRTTQEIEDMGLPYDLGSVMHYGSNAFTKDWDEITIQTRDKKFQRTIGQRAEPSFIDVKQVNRLYCHNTCPKFGGPACKNGGYVDPNNCHKCKCPPGLGGAQCDTLPKSEALCGGELIATPLWQELGHRGKKKCYWRIKTNNARIKIILSNVTYRCETTCKAYVEIKANSDFQQTGFRTCCQDEVTVTSEQAEVLIMTESSILDYETGFQIRYIQDSGLPLPKPPPPAWVPGQENRGFRGGTNSGGSVEKFILNALPKIRDANRPLESIASIVAEYSLASLLGIKNR